MRSVIFFTTQDAVIADAPPSRYIPNIATPRPERGPIIASAGTNMPMRSRYTGRRAEHVASGTPSMVAMRSLLEGMVRVAMTPGIAHANADSIATNARPSSPALLITRSMRKAARDM